MPQKAVVRTDLLPFEQETQPLAKIWCVKMEEDTHQLNELNSQMRVMKTYLKARYRLSDLLRAQRNDRMTSNLKRWIEIGSPDKGDLEEDSYCILRQYFMQKEGRLYLNKDGIVACKRREEDRVLYKYNAIVLPQLYQTELLFRSHEMRSRKKYNPYGDDFVVDRIDLKKIVEEVVGLEEITVSQDRDIVDDHNDEWVDDWSKPEVEFDDEQQQSYEQDLTNLRVLEWLNEMTSDPEETSVTIQDVDRESMKYIKTERDDPSWAAQEGRLLIPASNLDLIPGMRSTGTSMDIFVRGVGVGLTHTENLIIKKLRIARETGDLEAETGEEPKKPDIGRVVESYFNLPNEYSSNIILTDSDFILTNRTCAIAITADMSFGTALAADFKRECKDQG